MSKKKNNTQVASVNPFDIDFRSVMQEMADDYNKLTDKEKAEVNAFFGGSLKAVATLANTHEEILIEQAEAELALSLAEQQSKIANDPDPYVRLGWNQTPIKGSCGTVYWIAEDLPKPKYAVGNRVWFSLAPPFRFCEGIILGNQTNQLFSAEAYRAVLETEYLIALITDYDGINDLITLGLTTKKLESELFETATDLRTYWEKQLEQASPKI